MSRFPLFGFVIDHCDNCPRCLQADFCDEGKALMRRAAQLGAEWLVPDVPIAEPKAKA